MDQLAFTWTARIETATLAGIPPQVGVSLGAYGLTFPPAMPRDEQEAAARLIGAAPGLARTLVAALGAWADQFDGPDDQDLNVSGADLVDWFARWRLDARAALAAAAVKS